MVVSLEDLRPPFYRVHYLISLDQEIFKHIHYCNLSGTLEIPFPLLQMTPSQFGIAKCSYTL